MTLGPIVLAMGCMKWHLFKICPVKTIIGDYKKETKDPSPPPSSDVAKDKEIRAEIQ